MIKELMKKFSKPAQATQEEDVTMIDPTEQASALADKTAELSAQLETVTASFSEAQAQLAALTTQYEAATAALAASAEAQAVLATQAATKRLEARTAAITLAVGTSQLESLLEATDAMDDNQFNVIVGAMAKSFENEAQSAMFKETGVAADAPAVEVDAVQKMAEKFAAEFQTK